MCSIQSSRFCSFPSHKFWTSHVDLRFRFGEGKRDIIKQDLPITALLFFVNDTSNVYFNGGSQSLQTVFNGSTPKTPLIFVLSPGVDPTAQVRDTNCCTVIRQAYLPSSLQCRNAYMR